MNSVNKTLYITLYGKALVSKKGIILKDKTAEEIWKKVEFPLKGKSKSKWLAYFMAMRSRTFDDWVKEELAKTPNATVIHIGAGLDSRAVRVEHNSVWFDIDLESVIDERRKYYPEGGNYRMMVGDASNGDFTQKLPSNDNAVVILEGVSMYIKNQDLINTIIKLKEVYKNLSILVDCYTPFAVKMSKFKNPVNDVGVTTLYGIESPSVLEKAGITFERELLITRDDLIGELKGFENFIFKKVYAGKTSKKLYKLYEYKA